MEIQDFFSLEFFAHKDLWRAGDPLWAPLYRINDYFKTQHLRVHPEIRQGVVLENVDSISIGEGTVIEAGAYIQGPCIIGRNCFIRHGAYLRGGVICGDRVTIGHGTEIKHSILLDGAAAAHLNYVGDSILGNEVNLGAGVKCANLRLDRLEIVVFEGPRKVQTGLSKFGALIGDRSQIGCNCVLNPGTLVGKESFSHPLSHFGGTIPPRSKIVHEVKTKVEPMIQPLLEQLVERARAP